jgi:hypothetical protein
LDIDHGSDCDFEDITANNSSHPSCQDQRLINNVSTIFLLESLDDPQSYGIEIEFISEGPPTV